VLDAGDRTATLISDGGESQPMNGMRVINAATI